MGCGAAGQLAAEIHELEQAKRRDKQREWREQVGADAALDGNVEAVGEVVRSLTDAVLLCNGHRTHRGQWRRKRSD